MSWITKSNRQDHLLYGSIIYMVLFGLNMGFNNPIVAAVASLEVVIGVAMALEFKDQLYGNKADWLDMLATILLPAIVSVVVILFTVWNMQ